MQVFTFTSVYSTFSRYRRHSNLGPANDKWDPVHQLFPKTALFTPPYDLYRHVGSVAVEGLLKKVTFAKLPFAVVAQFPKEAPGHRCLLHGQGPQCLPT